MTQMPHFYVRIKLSREIEWFDQVFFIKLHSFLLYA